MSAPYGIDLGTTNSVIAHLVNGRPQAIAVAGSPIVPSVVLFQRVEGKERVVVGREARNLALLHPAETVRSVKRRMGEEHVYEIGGRRLTPEDVSAEILRALKVGAEQATGEEVRDVVITVPAYFNDAQRRATLRAGELAGLNVLRLLNEPTAASLVYEHSSTTHGPESTPGPEIVLIYDLGGGTFDVSVLEVFDGVREVRATTGNSRLGGDDFDDLLQRYFLDELRVRASCDPREDARAMARLSALAEDTKIKLSSQVEVQVREEFLTTSNGKPVHLDVTVTRRQFEDMVRPLLESTIALAHRAVDDRAQRSAAQPPGVPEHHEHGSNRQLDGEHEHQPAGRRPDPGEPVGAERRAPDEIECADDQRRHGRGGHRPLPLLQHRDLSLRVVLVVLRHPRHAHHRGDVERRDPLQRDHPRDAAGHGETDLRSDIQSTAGGLHGELRTRGAARR